RGCNLLVSAAAGSGKTAVLVERIIGLITDPTDPVSLDELLVMTFTRAAAEEMRERVGRALSERIELDPKNSWLKLQRAILPRARIATIDSVCQNLIRQYYQELEIDPGFRAAEESELKLVRMDILEKMISEQHEEAGEDFLNLVDSLSGKRMDERVSVLIEKLSSFADSCEWPDRFLSKQEEVCLKEEAGELSGLPWYESVLEWIQESTKEYLPLLSRAEELCEEPGGPDPYLDGVRECISYARIITGCSTYEDLWDKVHKMRFSSLKRTNKTKHDPEMTAFVKAVRDSFKAFVADKLQGKFLLLKPEDLKLSAAGAARINRELIRLTRIFRERYAEKKREKNQVDFSDMEHLALQLLYEETEDGMRPNALADELAGQFKEIMIDEYQDSNGVQEALLAALSAERFGRPDIFMVGDVKQSIYRFRQAEPHLFIEKYQSYTEDGIHKRIELNRNFRSRAEVLSSVNDVFDCIMRKELGGVEYDEKARLYPGASYPDPEDCKTEFLVMDPGSGTDDDVDTEEAEYRMIAGRILRLCQAGPEEGFTVQDRQSGKPRRAQFRDIAILMRAAKGHAEKLVDILSEYGIPAYFQNSTGYFSAPEVEVMLALLSVIDNPRQDIPLDAVMRSPIGGFSDDELALIRASYEEACAAEAAVPGDFYEAVKFRAKEDEKTQGFLSRLDGWRQIADVVPVHLLLEQLFTDTGYYDQTAAGPDGMIRRKNLDMLLESAESYGQLNYHGLFQFTRYIEQQKKYDTDHGEAGAVTENDNIVKVMTIHGSKGLEFPVVFLARMATTPKGNDREEGIVADRKIGLGGDYTDPENGIRYPGLKKAFIKEIYAREDQGEQLRLFYVAMTRAREKLILTAARAKASERCEDALNTASAFFAEQ
ncbi:MAG: helicase-exonuclease AddAB subunit AddA, partial [Lachnospiraceae bacterium]|nr:helicase-exonuclease AddAB subunit AddA [Lachnospiraceae bacterium]